MLKRYSFNHSFVIWFLAKPFQTFLVCQDFCSRPLGWEICRKEYLMGCTNALTLTWKVSGISKHVRSCYFFKVMKKVDRECFTLVDWKIQSLNFWLPMTSLNFSFSFQKSFLSITNSQNNSVKFSSSYGNLGRWFRQCRHLTICFLISDLTNQVLLWDDQAF